MGQPTKSRLVHGTLPRDVEYILSSIHIEKVLELPEEKFNDFQKQTPSTEYREAFVELATNTLTPY